MSNFHIKRLEIIQKTCSIWFPIFCDFCQPVIIHPVYMISPYSSPNSDSSYDISNFADVVNIFDTFLPLLLLMGSCFVFYPICLFSCNVDVRFPHERFGGSLDGLECLIFHFLRYLQAGYHLSCLYDLSMLWRLILAHLMTSRISQMLQMSSLRSLSGRALPVMHFMILIFVVLSKRLVMLLFQ